MLHDFTNATSNRHLVLGAGANRQVIAPGATVSFDPAFLIAEDLTQITAGEITVSPALPSSIYDALDAGSNNEKINKIIDYVISTDAKIIFPEAGPLAGTAGGAAVEVTLQVVNDNDIVDTFNDVAQVTVGATGDAVIAETMPLTFENGVATINVTDATAETTTLSLSSGPAGIDVTDTVDITYS